MSFYGHFDTSVNNTKGAGKGKNRDFSVNVFRVSVERLDFSKDTVKGDS